MKKYIGMQERAVGCLAAAVSALCMPALVCAQGASTSTSGSSASLDEVVITATKREISIKDVPLAVSAIGGESLQQNNIAGIGSLTQIDPSFQVQNRGPGDSQIIVRGIQSAGASLVSVYIDEALTTGQSGLSDFNGGGGRQTSFQLHDVERVEILKGPQGTLFGSGSMAGSLRIVANKPVLDQFSFGASVSAEGGSGTNALYDAHAVVNLPIVQDRLGLRVTAWNRDGGGYLDRRDAPRTVNNTNDEHIRGARGIMEWRASDALKLTLTAMNQSLEVDDLNFFRRNSGEYVIGAPAWGQWDESNRLYSLVGEYSLPVGTITAATSYTKRKILYGNDTTPVAGVLGLPGAYQINEFQDRSIWSSEVRFASDFSGPFQMVGGVFHEVDADRTNNMIGVTVPGTGNAACLLYADCLVAGRAEDVVAARALQRDANQFAVFAQGDYNITDALTFTAGVRVYRATIDWEELQLQGLRRSLTAPVQGAPIVTLDEKNDQNNTGYNFSLGWRPTGDLSLYVRAASGFRLGGINALLARQVDPTVPVGYNSDKLWNYEVGAKVSFFDRRLSVDGAIYYIDWSGQQVSTLTRAGVYTFISNAGTSDVKGVELQVTARPVDGLTLTLGGTYTDSRLTEDQPPINASAGRDGDRLPLVPKWSGAGRVRYEWPAGSNTFYAQTAFNYRGTAYTAFHAGPDYIPLESYWRADATVGMKLNSWDISLFVQNLTDEVAQVGVAPLTGVVTAGDAQITTIRPRTVGIKISTGF